MNDYGKMLDGLGPFLAIVTSAVFFSLLGLWKLVELAIWCWQHIDVVLR